MSTVIDTPIWSLALRRRRDRLSPDERALVHEWHELVVAGEGLLIGPVRQEVLTGIADDGAFEATRVQLEGVADAPLATDDFVRAARFANTCRNAGIQGTHTDFLICAVAEREQADIFSRDDDFVQFTRVLPIRLHRPRAMP